MDTLPFLALVVVAVAAAFVGGLYLQNSLDASQPVVLSSDPGADEPPPTGDLPGSGSPGGSPSG